MRGKNMAPFVCLKTEINIYIDSDQQVLKDLPENTEPEDGTIFKFSYICRNPDNSPLIAGTIEAENVGQAIPMVLHLLADSQQEGYDNYLKQEEAAILKEKMDNAIIIPNIRSGGPHGKH
jgi:hypothetical protein